VIIKYSYRKNSSLKEIAYITAMIVANSSSLSYLVLSIGGEIISLEGRLWAIDSFELSLKLIFPLLSLALSLPLGNFRLKSIALDLMPYFFPDPEVIRTALTVRLSEDYPDLQYFKLLLLPPLEGDHQKQPLDESTIIPGSVLTRTTPIDLVYNEFCEST